MVGVRDHGQLRALGQLQPRALAERRIAMILALTIVGLP